MIGWIIGQVIIGILCGLIYARTKDRAIFVVEVIIVMILSNAVYQHLSIVGLNITPISLMFKESVLAHVVDTIPMILGMVVGTKV